MISILSDKPSAQVDTTATCRKKNINKKLFPISTDPKSITIKNAKPK
jgi:hypothetical protein